MKAMRYATVVLGILASVCTSAVDRRDSASLTLKATCRTSNGRAELRSTLRNVGADDTSLVLGIAVGNGRRLLPNALVLSVKAADSSATRDFEYFDPSVPAIFGRLDPWIVSLPSASEFSITRPLSHFWLNGASLTDLPRPIRV